VPEPEAEVAAEAEVKMEAPPATTPAAANDAPDPVFERAREAQKTSLRACGQKDLIKLSRKGELGRDGKVRIADGWQVELTPDPPKYKADAKPRGKNLAKRPLKEGDLDDEPTEEELYQAAIAAELEEGSDEDDAVAAPKAAAAAQPKRKRACGEKQRLMAQLGLYIRYQCELCSCPPVFSMAAVTAHRKGPQSCIRSKEGSARSGSVGSAARLDAFVAKEQPMPAPATTPRYDRTPFKVPGSATTSATATPGSTASRSSSTSARSGGGGRSGRGGRGRKSAATLAQEKASLAAFLARKYGHESKLAREVASGTAAASEAEPDEVECLGEKTRAERDAEGREAAEVLEE
jgi:hypothetical protein